MKRLGTLAMAIVLLTGYNAIQTNMEETELLWRETEKRIEAWALPIETKSSPTEIPPAIRAPEGETLQETSEPAEESIPQRR